MYLFITAINFHFLIILIISDITFFQIQKLANL